ncbi:uncharacterized protein MICPUCDRAFT_58905 [Micromonas pusilla CCMP1545]|uniref:Predicted protein n=1 Tax=Micromonas pusilla (strain CCMP1545) TaxID=564608 RepID=C1MUR4_MICPC|nr:uncharacterized protein MICPUCDRAFT_58905 [Micromonas pusilla CCMP1545]EEH56371.1 predicted protein [Micromonas pusilla CCMP1545]|eukprot:XP_003059239.1 predicted protein [Micromonas pusilla CCMP1545]
MNVMHTAKITARVSATRARSSAPARAPIAKRAASTTTRVYSPPNGSIDFGSVDEISGSVDADQDLRAAMVERDTAETLRRTIAAMGGAPVQDPAAFISTPEQRLQTSILFGSCAALCARGVVGVHENILASGGGDDPLAYASLLAAAVGAWWLSDLGTGIFHWSVDNYGSKQTPVMGDVIDAFQGHHKYPWTITKRQFANNTHTTCPATSCVTIPLLLTPDLGPNACVFMGVFCSMVVLSQQFHAWSHAKKSELPALVIAAQDAGLVISRKAHGQHHKPPFEGRYCIVSGWWNDALDGSGVLKRAERFIYDTTGVAARCWTEATFNVQEEAPEGWGNDIIR